MGFIENWLTEGNLDESRLMARLGSKLVGEQIELSGDEKALLRTYIIGYYAVQKSGEFVDYKKEPHWRFLRMIPPIPQVVDAAEMTTRIGEKLIDESVDFEHILRVGKKIPKRQLRNLGNLLSGEMALVEDGKFSDKKYSEVRSKLSKIVENWSLRPENQIA